MFKILIMINTIPCFLVSTAALTLNHTFSLWFISYILLRQDINNLITVHDMKAAI